MKQTTKIFALAVDNSQQENQSRYLIRPTNLDTLVQAIHSSTTDLSNAL